MPINFEWDRDLEEWDWSTVSGGLDSLEVPSEEFWKKFEELPDLGDNLETLFAEVSGLGTCASLGGEMLRNHDCMWAGVCLSKDHNKESPGTLSSSKPASPAPATPTFQTTAPQHQQPASQQTNSREKKRTVIVQNSRSLLLTNRTAEILIRPDTPQSMGSESEEEPVSATRAALPASQVTGQVRRKCPAVTVGFDHDYEAKKVVRTDDLGVVTPSDSEEEEEEEQEEEQEVEEEEIEEEEEEEVEEDDDDDDDEDEEIDVVSLSSTRTNPLKASSRCSSPRTPSRGMVYNGYGYATPRSHQVLPTNPTTQVRNQLQETVADSLLTASRAVSRRLVGSVKRKRGSSLRSPTTTPATPGPGRGRRRVTPVAKKSRYSSSQGYLVDTEKRSLHNNMERMRRIDLRNAFEDLRQLVPTIADSQKAAKVTILKDATHYVKELNLKDRNLSVQLEALRSEQDRLRRTLSHLRRILVSKNIAN